MTALPFDISDPTELLRYSVSIERALSEKSFYEFFKLAWHVIEPRPYADSWHIKLVCDTAQRVVTFQEEETVYCLPPGVSKSTILMVALPAWVWTWRPDARFICLSSTDTVAMRDSMRTRELVSSEWYMERWKDTRLSPDNNQKHNFSTTARGTRFTATIKGGLTGMRGDYGFVDDPHNVLQVESDADRETARMLWEESLPGRLDPQPGGHSGRRMLIQQMVHTQDCANMAIRRGMRKIVLPMEYEPDHPHLCPDDPRTEFGELLCPDRFSAPMVEKLKKQMTRYSASAQLQQRPVPREGGLFQAAWFKIVDKIEEEIVSSVRGWDLAATESGPDPDYTAKVKTSRGKSGRIYIEHAKKFRGSPHTVETEIKTTAALDGTSTVIDIPQDPGQAGKSQVDHLVKTVTTGYIAYFSPESGSKETRASPLASTAEAGNIYLVRGEWNAEFIEEVCGFPNFGHDDYVDAAARSFNRLARTSLGLLGFYASEAEKKKIAEVAAKEAIASNTVVKFFPQA